MNKNEINFRKKIRFLTKKNKLLMKFNRELNDNVIDSINFISELIKNKK